MTVSDDTHSASNPDPVILDPGRSLIVSAGAGTGKTRRLVRRYLKSILEDGVAPAQVMAITFTRAAAAEMKERLLELLNRSAEDIAGDKQLAAILAGVDESTRTELREQIAAAPIDTIHGMCARILAEFPELSQVEPSSRPIEPGEDGILRDLFLRQWIDDVLDERIGGPTADLAELLRQWSMSRVIAELSAIMQDAGELQSSDYDVASASGVQQLRADFARTQFELIQERLAPYVEDCLSAIDASTDAKGYQELEDEHRPCLRDFLCEDIDLLRFPIVLNKIAFNRKTLWDPESLDDKSISSLSNRKALGATYQAARNALADEAKALLSGRCKGIRTLDLRRDSEHCDSIARWIRVGLAAASAYSTHLQERGLLRYDDLELHMQRMLERVNGGELDELDLTGRYEQILVDEFQDTNPRQIELIEGLAQACGDEASAPVLFFVGDEKQSIYRFRGADVHVFKEKLDEARDEQTSLEHAALAKTWRFSPPLTRFFNRFFPGLLEHGYVPNNARQDLDEHPLSKVPFHPIQCGRKDGDGLDGAAVELLLNLAPDQDSDAQSPPLAEQAGSMEAARVAAYVEKVLDEGATRRKYGKPKPLGYGDFAILLRHWTHAEKFRRALELKGIPAQVSGARGLMEQPEVQDLNNLVRFLANWQDSLAAVGVLRGPAFGLSDLGLYVLARWPGILRSKDGEWVDWESNDDAYPLRYPRSLHQVARTGRLQPNKALAFLKKRDGLLVDDADELQERLQADGFALMHGRSILQDLFDRAGSEPTADLLADAIVRFRLEAVWKATGGKRAVANAWKFVDLVRQVEAEGPDPGRVVRWLDSEPSPSQVGLLSADPDAVTISTIHGAKGMEWPVVILADLGNPGGGGGGSSWNYELVPALAGDAKETRRRVPLIRRKQDGFAYDSDNLASTCSALSKPLEIAEQKRLLYVGMTRAEERVVLSHEYKRQKKYLRQKNLEIDQCSKFSHFVYYYLDLEPDADEQQLVLPENSPFRDHARFVRDGELDLTHVVERPLAPDTAERKPGIVAWKKAGERTRSHPSADAPLPNIPSLRWQAFKTVDPSELGAFQAVKETLDDGASEAARIGLGNLFHAVMEDWNFVGEAPDDERCADIATTFFPDADGSAHAGWLRECIDKLQRHDLFAELAQAARDGRLHHEAAIDAIIPTRGDGEVRLSGYIDLLWQDAEGNFHILDYKATRQVTSQAGIEKLQKSYGPQLFAYRRVLEQWLAANPDAGTLGRVGLWLAPAGEAMWLDVDALERDRAERDATAAPDELAAETDIATPVE